MSISFMRSLFKNHYTARGRVEPELAASASSEFPSNREGTAFLPTSRSQLLESHVEILRRIKLCYGREPQQFEREILAVVERYADFVNALPATANNYYSFPGGLFRLGLDTAFFALQATDAQIFEGRGTITQRRHLEPRWRHAAFIAGLCAELQPLLNILTVSTQQGSNWPSYMLPLSGWLERHRGANFHIVWSRAARIDGMQNLYALPYILPPAMMEYLAEQNDVVVPAMLASLSRLPLAGPPATMTSLVRRAAALAIEKEMRRMSAARGLPMLGDNLARLLIDAMHDLVHSAATWVPNTEKSRVWHAQDGTFVVWPGACHDISAYADRERLNGVPRDADTMLFALQDAGMIERGLEGYIWHIQPPGAAGDVECVKLAVPELVIATQLSSSQALPPLCSVRNARPNPGAKPLPSEAPPTPIASPESEPAQLELALHDSPPSADVPPEAPPAGELNLGPIASPALTKCLRLPADVAEVVRRALESLDGSSTAAGAHIVREGVLIPLELFKAARLDTRLAMRSLRDAGMLVVGETGNPTYAAKVNGSDVRGLVLKRRFVTGLPQAD